jgi:hypothetical protein
MLIDPLLKTDFIHVDLAQLCKHIASEEQEFDKSEELMF